MDNKLHDILPATLHFGEPTTVLGLGILPILNDQPNSIVPPLATLDEALEKGEVIISEVSEDGQVPFLLVENKAGELLILEGECLFGGRQNRIMNTTVLVLAQASVRIAVSCVEQGRWGYRSREFTSGKSLFRASSRAVQKRGVTESLHREGIPLSHQGAVWSEVERSLRELGVHSRTADFQDAGAHVEHRIEDFLDRIRPIPNQIGSIFFSHQGVVGAELLTTPDLFSRCHDKIASSFVFDLLSAPPLNGVSVDPIKTWWREALASTFGKHKSIGVGDDIRTESHDLIGSGLMYEGTMIHFSCFPSSQPLPLRRLTGGSRASARDRRRNLRSQIDG